MLECRYSGPWELQHWNINQNLNIFIEKNAFGNVQYLPDSNDPSDSIFVSQISELWT